MTTSNKLLVGIAALMLVAGVALSVFTVQHPVDQSQPNYGGQFYDQSKTFGTELGYANDGKNGYASAFGATFVAGQAFDYWQNRTGYTVYIDSAVFGTSGAASSSFKLYAFATTSDPSTLASRYAFTAFTEAINGQNSFLGSPTYATSTAASTTNSAIEAKAGRGNGVIAVPNNGYLVFLLQGVDAAGCASTLKCEAATSTARGFNPFWHVRYYR